MHLLNEILLMNDVCCVAKVTKKSTIAKAIGSGTGVVAGGLTLVGGALTIATGGLAAVPVLIGKLYNPLSTDTAGHRPADTVLARLATS